MPAETNAHYVKFVRGYISAWERLLLTPERIDNDTLYFIYENIANPQEGKLYLGQKLISGESGSGGVININDLTDIEIDGDSLSDKQILVYNETTEKWENASLSTIIDEFVGATASTTGVAGIVPAPAAGDENKFLRGDKTWATVDMPSFDQEIFSTTSNNQVSLKGYSSAPVNSIPFKSSSGISWMTNISGTIRREVTTLEKLQNQIAGTDPDPLDSNTIYMVPNGNDASTNNRYDEYLVINNSLEHFGSFGTVDLANYVQKTIYDAEVAKLEDVLYDKTNTATQGLVPGLITEVSVLKVNQTKIGDLNQLLLSSTNTTLVEEVNTINSGLTDVKNRLKWQELEDE